MLALFLFVLAVIGLAATAPKAEAHAELSRSEPPADAKLMQAPTELRLYFTQAIVRRGSYVQVKDAGGSEVPVQVVFDDADPKSMKATLPALTPGVYTVKWQSLSADDDDYADGSYKLTILKPDGSSTGAGGDSKASDGGGSLPIVLIVVGGVLGVGAGVVLAMKRRGGVKS